MYVGKYQDLTQDRWDVIVVGGGAAGFFAVNRILELNPAAEILILEKSDKCLQKVKVSGGGRCNVTCDQEDPRELVNYYPRGKKELLGPFYAFGPAQTKAWFESKGIGLKTEDDGRVFPESDKSTDIIACLFSDIKKHHIPVWTACGLKNFDAFENGWQVKCTNGKSLSCQKLLIAAGGSPFIWDLLRQKGIAMVSQVPSLFTFRIPDPGLQQLAGLSCPEVKLRIPELKAEQHGPLLITHWGLSGPAVLKLSAFSARELYELDFKAQLEINWVGDSKVLVSEKLLQYKDAFPSKRVETSKPFDFLAKRLWQRFLNKSNITTQNWADLNKQQITSLLNILTSELLPVRGKSTFKEEFVTAGGVDLKEINFKNFQHKSRRGLYLAGEVLDIDALTGGYNFQAAWTGAWLAGTDIARSI